MDWDIRYDKWNPELAAQTWGGLSDRLTELYRNLQCRFSIPEDFLWCYLSYTYWLADIRQLWRLEVPSGRILCYVNGRIWHQLSQQEFGTLSEEDAWASLVIPDVEAYGEERFAEALKPGGDLVGLHPDTIRKTIQEEVSALIAVPIPENWVKEDNRFSIGTSGKSLEYHELPTSLQEAQARSKQLALPPETR